MSKHVLKSENKHAAENLQYAIDCALKNQVPGIIALKIMEKELEKAVEEHDTRAKKCGVSEDCLRCFQFAWCVKNRAEKQLLFFAKTGRKDWEP